MEENQTVELPAVSDGTGSAMALVMDNGAMESMMNAAKLMASAKVTIPAHLRNSQGDCMAVIMQSAQWKMNPFAVAQKTFISQGGQLGYEGQLVNAVIVSSGSIKGQPEFTFTGNWNKILGKAKEMKSDKGGKYYVSDWDRKDEDGLGVTVTATLRGESGPRSIEVMMSQAWPRFSTQWATDPKQQITYLAVRKFARRYAPGAILGVYTEDELDGAATEKDVTPKRQTGAQVADAVREHTQAGASESITSAMRDNAILDLELIAREQGAEEYKLAWMALSKALRVSITVAERDRIMKIAESIPGEATETVDTGTGEVSHD